MRRMTHSPAQQRWRQSAEFRAIASATAKRNLKGLAELPRCGARRRSDGEPCQNPGTGAGGRCRLHGGKTPAGSGWHRPAWPDKKSANLERKLRRKLDQLARDAERRRRRVAALTPEQRERYETWLRDHDPRKSPGERAARRHARAGAPVALAADPSPTSPDVAAAVADLQRRIDVLRHELVEAEQQGIREQNALCASELKGVFE